MPQRGSSRGQPYRWTPVRARLRRANRHGHFDCLGILAATALLNADKLVRLAPDCEQQPGLLPRRPFQDEVEVGLIQAIGGLRTVLPENLGPFPALVGGVAVGLSEVGAPAVAVGRQMAPDEPHAAGDQDRDDGDPHWKLHQSEPGYGWPMTPRNTGERSRPGLQPGHESDRVRHQQRTGQ